jgi:hypothetical protein
MQKPYRAMTIIDDLTEVVATFISSDEVEFLVIKDSQAFPHIAPQEVTLHSRDDMRRLQAFIGRVLEEADNENKGVVEDSTRVIGPDGLSEDEINKMIKEAV